MAPKLPPYLQSRANLATQRARDIASTAAPPAAVPPVQAASTSAPDTKAKPSLASSSSAKPKAARATKVKGGGNPSRAVKANQADVAAMAGEFEHFADQVTGAAQDQVVALAVRPHLPGVLGAMVRGAQVPGSTGAADRSMLLRLMKHPSSTAAAQAKAGKQVHIHLGQRLAQSRVARDTDRVHVIDGVSEALSHANATAADFAEP